MSVSGHLQAISIAFRIFFMFCFEASRETLDNNRMVADRSWYNSQCICSFNWESLPFAANMHIACIFGRLLSRTARYTRIRRSILLLGRSIDSCTGHIAIGHNWCRSRFISDALQCALPIVEQTHSLPTIGKLFALTWFVLRLLFDRRWMHIPCRCLDYLTGRPRFLLRRVGTERFENCLIGMLMDKTRQKCFYRAHLNESIWKITERFQFSAAALCHSPNLHLHQMSTHKSCRSPHSIRSSSSSVRPALRISYQRPD